jgi:hypothetical protein
MGSRRPKPTALKERTSVRPNLGLSRLFSVANALVPQVSDDKTMKLEDPRLRGQEPVSARDQTNVSVVRAREAKEESDYGTAVVVPNRKRAKPAAEGTKTQPVSVRTSVTALNKAEKKKSSKKFEIPTKYLALLFIVPAIGLFSYAYFTGSLGQVITSQPAVRQSALSPEQIKERLEFHREITGSHLNPLRPEANIYSRSSKPDLPYDPTYSEAKMGYGLQEEQNHAEFEKLAQKEWIKEFVENARKGGYNVKIDAFGNVKYSVIPAEQRGPLPETNPVFSDDR